MCGISGIIDLKKKNNLNEVSYFLLSQLNHRGPDYNDTFIDNNTGLLLCHNRLSIIDTSLRASQPMRSYCGRYIIVFNGEIYNYLELKQKIVDTNIKFKSSSDTEVLLNSISKLGLKNTLDKINGMFAFVLWDTLKKEIILCRDRFGQKPLYYAFINEVFIFSSELKSIKNFYKKNLSINQKAFYYFNKYGYINEPMTIYNQVFKLKASNYLKISINDLIVNQVPKSICYWNFRKNAHDLSINNYVDFNEAKNKIYQEINNSVSECMVSDVPIGCFLSGGLDSSIVSYFMQKNSSKKINTFSMGNQDSDYDESSESRATSKFLNTNHTEFFLNNNDIINIVEKIPEIYDEPFADSSQIPTIYLSQKTSSEVKVVLTGDGGDEMFGGYNRHIYSNKIHYYIKYLPPSIRIVIKNIFDILPIGFKKILLNIISNEKNIKLLEIKIQKIISIIQSKDKKILYDRLCSQLDFDLNIFKNNNYNFNNINYFKDWPDFDSYLNEMLILDAEFYLNGDILVKLDRASMHSSLETRSPLLSNYVFNEVWKLNENFKIKNNKGKLIMQSIANDIFPPNFLSRPKIGFGIPIGVYLKTNLNIWANDLINSNILKHDMFINHTYVKKIWKEHCNNIKDWSFTLWNLLNYLHWKNKIQND